jgi:AraC-like DNA-binding protein
MRDLLSIRSYSKILRKHKHSYYQLVLPLQGFIEITIQNKTLRIRLGDCCVIKSEQFHSFKADEESRFIVADLEQLPPHFIENNVCVFSISSPLKAYLYFLDNQLQHRINDEIEKQSLDLFKRLLERQSLNHQKDDRIEKVLHEIQQDLSYKWTIKEFANLACLSLSQFKAVFQNNLGMSPMQYLTIKRMEKAQALLVHTDTPLSIIAELTGYKDTATFGRRFTLHFGQPPKTYAKNHKS